MGDLRDIKGGTYDTDPGKPAPSGRVERRTAHEDAQPGAEVRPETAKSPKAMPEGLARGRIAADHKVVDEDK